MDGVSAADDLHQRLFGVRPKKTGTAYERLAALVLAVLGWEDVKHDTKLRLPGRQAEHQLDVTATHPDGTVRRLLVECKDWDARVQKGTLDALVGVRDQSGFDDALVVTTKGFTAGALDVASDEDIAVVILRDHRPEDKGRFVRRVEANLDFFMPAHENFDFKVAEYPDLPNGTVLKFGLAGTDRFLHLDGTPAETLEELVQANGAPLQEGVFECSADLGEGRLVAAEDGTQVRVTALTWTETMRPFRQQIVSEAPGEPCLVLEQLDGNGDPHRGRLVVDQQLYAWAIGEDGTVVPRGELV
jgi:hypothetical protein